MFSREKFVIDSIPGIEFLGFSDGDTWNGWACPYFERDEAERVLRYSESNGFYWQFRPNVDAYEVRLDRNSSNQEPELFQGTVIQADGQELKVYPIGAYSWIWETLGTSD